MPQHLTTVVIVTDSVPAMGGAEKVALDSAAMLAQNGLDVWVFFGAGDPPEIPGVRFVSSGGTHLKELSGVKQKATTGIWNRTTYDRAVAFLRALPTGQTVVHAHSYMNVHTPSVLGAVRDSGFPLVITAHDYGLACPTLGFYDGTIPGVCPHRALSMGCVLSRCTGTSYVNKLGFVARSRTMRRRASLPRALGHLIAVSRGSADILKPYMPNTAFHVVTNPADISKPESRIVAEGNRAFGWLGRMTPEKHPAALAVAAAEAGVEAIFVGDGPERAAAESANPKAEFVGQMDRAGVQAQFERFRALVMTSRWYEAAPLVIQEAHARGIPVLVPTVCAGRDAVSHGETGLHYDVHSQQSLVDAIRQLEDDATCQQMSEAAFQLFWSNPPSPERHVRELLAVYEAALAGK